MFEANVFFPVDSELDQEEWPLMELTNASVFLSKRTSPIELEDLLDVQDRGPFRIEGTLTPIPSELKDIIRTKNATRLYREPLVITNVMVYSIQQFEDGDVKIWALGKCGWYSIIPSPKYEPIFRTMVEKGKLWVFLQDKYEKFSGKGKNIKSSVEDLYASYVKLEPSLPNVLAASQLFEKHYRYLLFEMCGIRADTDMWMRTPLFRHFASKYAPQLRAIRRSMACSSDRMDNSTPVKQETSPVPPSPTLPVYALPPPSARPKVHGRSSSCTILKLFSEYVHEKSLEQAEITRDLIIQFVNDSFVFESYQGAAANVDARAEDFLSIMEHTPLFTAYNWIETPAYKQLGFVRTSGNDAAVRQRKLIPKTPTQANNDGDDGEEEDEDDDEEEDEESEGEDENEDDEEDAIGVEPVYIKSPVKPPALAKGKSPARVPVRLQAPSSSETIDENDLGDTLEDTPAAAALRQKRVLDDLLSPRNGIPTAKRPRIRTAVSGSSVSPSSLSILPLMSVANSGLQLGIYQPPYSATSPETTRTNRSGDRWECEISGCNHTIPDADTAESLQLIEKHYAEHAQVIKKAMDAIDGGNILPSRPHHVNNLLAKIELMARKWAVSSPRSLTPLELGLPGPASAPTVSRAE